MTALPQRWLQQRSLWGLSYRPSRRQLFGLGRMQCGVSWHRRQWQQLVQRLGHLSEEWRESGWRTPPAPLPKGTQHRQFGRLMPTVISIVQTRKGRIGYNLQTMIAVTGAISAGSAVPWPTIMGIWKPAPHPRPARTWYPIQWADPVPISRVYKRPAPIVAKTEPRIRSGVAMPVKVTLPLETMTARDTAMINGRFRMPDAVGLTLSILW